MHGEKRPTEKVELNESPQSTKDEYTHGNDYTNDDDKNADDDDDTQ